MAKGINEQIKEILFEMCDGWEYRKDLAEPWGRTKNKQLTFKLKFSKWGFSKTGLIVFRPGVTEKEAKDYLDPIIKEIEEANKAGACKKYDIDIEKAKRIIDLEATVNEND